MSTGNQGKRKPKAKAETKSEIAKPAEIERPEYNYGDEIVGESGRKSRGGLKSLDELYDTQLVSGDLIAPTFKEKITIGVYDFTMNTACVRLFQTQTQNVKLSMDAARQRLIILPTTETGKDTAKVALLKDGINKPRKVTTQFFCALLFHHMGWSSDRRYRIMAIHQVLEGREMLVFNLDEAVEIKYTIIMTDDGKRKIKRSILLPTRFRDNNFGFDFGEVEERKKVNLDEMFLFINPHTGEEVPRKIEPRVPSSDEIIKSNYRPNPDKTRKKSRPKKSEGGDDG
jgi:hypothetical protein